MNSYVFNYRLLWKRNRCTHYCKGIKKNGRPEDALPHLVTACDMRPEDPEAHVFAALCSSVAGDEDRAYELVERARMAISDGDPALVDEAADRIEAGPDAARAHLMDTILPGALRERLMIRPSE